ncbi:hypothetical protein Dsin_021550 [Dipteronia sinensis]|uniref:DUF4283 domain-containing protein n=1 Tax=Dipteronia sinensis TaxID=43782 RepID=A0AAD9ZZV7_9ROSI|nr:hypothetical protein Dsin_021550 [Dipteronia sinensis]
MEKWYKWCALKARLVWINFIGVPLIFWNEEFFNKLGRLIGEVLDVEEDTLLRRRVDRGRILALVPHNQLCPRKVKVEVDRDPFAVNVFRNHHRLISPRRRPI